MQCNNVVFDNEISSCKYQASPQFYYEVLAHTTPFYVLYFIVHR